MTRIYFMGKNIFLIKIMIIKHEQTNFTNGVYGVPIKDTENIVGRKNLRGQKLCHYGVVIWSNSYPVQNI